MSVDGSEPLYFDSNATTPVRREVVERVVSLLEHGWGNASCDHPAGRRAREALEEARAQVAAFLGAKPGEILFTSGGTESSNIAIFGSVRSSDRRRVVTSTVEHPATSAPCAELREQGFDVVELAVDAECRVDLEQARSTLNVDCALLSVMHANNETGTLQPVSELAATAHEHGVVVHTDAAQSAGKIPVDVDALGVDLLSLAGHKLYAPKGVGALYQREGTVLRPVLRGAGHERGLRPGTENVAFVAGLGLACTLAAEELAQQGPRLARLRDQLWERLRSLVPGLRRHGHLELTLPNTLNVGFPGTTGRAILEASPGLAASTGSACHEGGHQTPSPVLSAMGIPAAKALGAVRLSLGRDTTEADVESAAQRLVAAWSAVVADPAQS